VQELVGDLYIFERDLRRGSRFLGVVPAAFAQVSAVERTIDGYLSLGAAALRADLAADPRAVSFRLSLVADSAECRSSHNPKL
jgi:hypothetical protein